MHENPTHMQGFHERVARSILGIKLGRSGIWVSLCEFGETGRIDFACFWPKVAEWAEAAKTRLRIRILRFIRGAQ